MGEHRFRCGDVVRQHGVKYDIELAYADYQSGYASWCGWPEGTVEIARLTLVQACTDEEHRKAVARWLDAPRSSSPDHRREAIERLHRPLAFWTRLADAARENVRAANEHLERCQSNVRAALQGPVDVAPLPASSPSQEGAPTSG